MPPNRVISNASPLINLSLVNKLSLLNKIFEEIIIPPSVYHEVVEQGKTRPGALEVKAYCEDKKIQIKKTTNLNLVKSLKFDLDDGESEAIALGLEIPDVTILLDEADARNVANKFNLKVTGFIGILLKAKKEGLITNFQELLDLAISKGFRINPELYRKVLNASTR